LKHWVSVVAPLFCLSVVEVISPAPGETPVPERV
jgi:hypothetical protein